MGKRKYVGKIKVASVHMKKIIALAKKIHSFSSTEKIEYFKHFKLVKSDEIDLISEIVFNFIKCNIKYDSNSFKLLQRVKSYMYMIASKKVSKSIKKKFYNL